MRAWLQEWCVGCVLGCRGGYCSNTRFGGGHCLNARMRRLRVDCASGLFRVGAEDATAIA